MSSSSGSYTTVLEDNNSDVLYRNLPGEEIEDSEITESILNSSTTNITVVSSNVCDVLNKDKSPDYLLKQNKSMKKSLFGDKGNNSRGSKKVQNPNVLVIIIIIIIIIMIIIIIIIIVIILITVE